MMSVIPTVFATNKKDFDARFSNILKISNNIQIDIMDGKFVKNKSIAINEIPPLKIYKKNFEAHLMVDDPIKFIKILKMKGFNKIIFHYEALKNEDKINEIISYIKEQNLLCFIAVNPETRIEKIKVFLDNVNGVLVMGVHPGEENQKLIDKTYDNIKKLRKINKNILIQIDGGVNLDNVKLLAMCGANLINSGSVISNSANPAEELNKLNRAFSK